MALTIRHPAAGAGSVDTQRSKDNQTALIVPPERIPLIVGVELAKNAKKAITVPGTESDHKSYPAQPGHTEINHRKVTFQAAMHAMLGTFAKARPTRLRARLVDTVLKSLRMTQPVVRCVGEDITVLGERRQLPVLLVSTVFKPFRKMKVAVNPVK